MNATSTYERLSTVFTRVMGVEPPHGPETSPQDVEAWDSLGHIKLFAEAESEFDRQLPDELMIPGHSLRQLAEAVDAAPPA
ncbi:acyl carrier protein [Catellatospora methionotrophica]|nr:acyl carrier protein [Catellatospora methionotrophica]